VNLSYYEVYITSLRAFTGMGFPFGADEDAAYMVSWLELNKLDGIKSLAKTYKNFDNQYNAKINLEEINNTYFDLRNISLLMKGPGLFDYYETQLQNNKNINISLINCIDPHYLLPLMFKASKKINYCKAVLNNENNENIIYQARKNLIQIGTTFDIKMIKDNQIELFFSNENIKINNFKKLKNEITPKTVQNSLASALSPDFEDWKQISNLANRTFVPESKESRSKGAGGGDAND